MERKTVIELTVKQVKEEFGINAFKEANLTKGPNGFSLSLLTSTEEVPLLLQDAGELKTWSSPDKAVRYMHNNFHGITTLNMKIGENQ